MKRFFRILCILFFGIFFRVEVLNRENVPVKGPGILCANHIGELDMFIIGYKIKRWVYWMAKEELFRIPVISFIIKCLGAFPVKRGKADINSIKTAMKLLNHGNIVGILPEGTRTRGKDRNKIRVKPGAALMAIKTGVPIIPVAIDGNYRLFSRIRVIFGKPFKIDAPSGRKYTSYELAEISRNIVDGIYALKGEG